MDKATALKIVKELPFDTPTSVYKNGTNEIFLLRPSKLSKRFKNYDVKKNFQVWLKYKDEEFRPNHMRLLVDLNLRVRSRPDLKKDLLIAFDNIFYGKDPEKELVKLRKEKFEHFLNEIDVIGNLAQFLLLEQEYCFHKSKYEPASLYLQGWIRAFIDSSREIDILLMSIAGFQPPPVKYTAKDDKKHKNYSKDVVPLWYLDDNS